MDRAGRAVPLVRIHGTFFERWCGKLVADSKYWRLVDSNQPVEFPPPRNSVRGRESNLDLHAARGNDEYEAVLLIECKKNNPNLTDWIFFPKPDPKRPPIDLAIVQITTGTAAPESPFHRRIVDGLAAANDARETKGDFKKPNTKTSNAAITEAAYQVTLAHHAIIYQAHKLAVKGGQAWKTRAYFPLIVTTARLRLCIFDPGDVSPSTGEIAYDKVKLEDQNILIYEYPVPPHLQGILTEPSAATLKDLEYYTRLQILVVHSEFFAELLKNFGSIIDARR